MTNLAVARPFLLYQRQRWKQMQGDGLSPGQTFPAFKLRAPFPPKHGLLQRPTRPFVASVQSSLPDSVATKTKKSDPHGTSGIQPLSEDGTPISGIAASMKKVAKLVSISVIVGTVMAMSFRSQPVAACFNMGPSSNVAGGGVGRGLVATSAWTGFAAGCLHTLTGPDHLAALAPLSVGRSKMESMAIGALWGCGHDAGQVLFGLIFLLLKEKLHIEVIRVWGARVVGMTLVAIGVLGIKEAHEMTTTIPCIAIDDPYTGVGGNITKVKIKTKTKTKTETNTKAKTKTNTKTKFGAATFATGIIHGLQPDALVMILPALSLPSRLAGASFLIMFLVGTIVAMGSYTTFIGSCSQALQERLPRVNESLSWGSSLVAIFVGLGILLGELFGASLF